MPRSYAYNLGLSWPDFLKVNEIRGVGDDVRSLKSEISSSTHKLIATNKELQEQQIEATKFLLNTISYGFEQLSSDISELSSVFEWGFSELLVEIGHLNDSLRELVKIAKNPAQTWAYEQFEMARDAFRRNLIEESLEYLDHAINGFGDNTGYKLEYRFHYLLGVIRIGSYKNINPKIIDLAIAEKSFLDASRYAKHDYPKEASRSLLSASWAAYCRRKIDESRQYVLDSISLNDDSSASYFQLAKILMHLDRPLEGIPHLKKAITRDKGYIIKAYEDDDFKKHIKNLDELSLELYDSSKIVLHQTISEIDQEKYDLLNVDIKGFGIKPYISQEGLDVISNGIKQLKYNMENGTYFSFIESIDFSSTIKEYINKEFVNGLQGLKDHLNANLIKLKDSEIDFDHKNGCWGPLGCVYMVITLGIAGSLNEKFGNGFLSFGFFYILVTYIIPFAVFFGIMHIKENVLISSELKEIKANASIYKETIAAIDESLQAHH